ncbi:uncharacterized protein F5147DRAFT_657029 [Suillus discolor]|uniref:Uncharacterized protein n=1 Tax=Suillus discolor TaxID=1912936 RepID=A0A9P7EY89_9AGAM|nr:uncharacterized protein F5147DRAFT_657029 [Suillus discolor]KAG2095151.1 hypothetical protein F5147DRAFT_657029 [Suillus discolor]
MFIRLSTVFVMLLGLTALVSAAPDKVKREEEVAEPVVTWRIPREYLSGLCADTRQVWAIQAEFNDKSACLLLIMTPRVIRGDDAGADGVGGSIMSGLGTSELIPSEVELLKLSNLYSFLLDLDVSLEKRTEVHQDVPQIWALQQSPRVFRIV